MFDLLTTLLVKICLMTAIGGHTEVSINTPYMSNDTLKIEQLYKELSELSSNRFTFDMSSKLDTLIQLTMEDQDRIGLFIWAVGKKVETLDRLSENGFEESYKLISDFLLQAKGTRAALLHGLLGTYLHTFYTYNSYSISERTDVISTEDMPLDSWTARQFFEQIVYHLDLSIIIGSQHDYPLSKLSVVINQASEPTWVNSLSEFLLIQAINILSNRNYWLFLNESVDPITLQEWAKPYQHFASISIQNEEWSTIQKTLGYYQLLLQELDQNSTAFIHFELERLDYVSRLSTSSELVKSIESTINQYLLTFNGHSGFILLAVKQIDKLIQSGNQFDYSNNTSVEGKGDLKKAIQLIDQYLEQMPDYYGVEMLAQRKLSLLSKSWNLQLETTHSSINHFPGLITYKNLEHLHVHIYKMETGHDTPNLYTGKQFKAYFSDKKAFRQIKVELPKDSLFHERRVEYIFDPLPVGKYVVFTSQDTAIDWEKQRGLQWIQITNIQLIVRQKENNQVDTWVVDNVTGQPIENAVVEHWTIDYNRQEPSRKQSDRKTNSSGMTSFEANGEFFFKVQYKESLVTSNSFYSGGRFSPSISNDQILMMTDRAIYRPGQIIYFKGITYKLDKQNQPGKLIKGKQYTIRLHDSNYTEVASIKVQANDWGGFDGSFVIPESGLPGYFNIQVDNVYNKGVLVENYKRPSFEVVFDDPNQQVAPGVQLTVKGKANTYSGSAIVGALVKYRIESYSWRHFGFSGFRGPIGQSPNQVIQIGETLTDETGAFQFNFTPPINDDKADRFFNSGYRISVDVMDSNGETRYGESMLALQNRSFVIQTDAPDKTISSQWDQISFSLIQANGKYSNGKANVSLIPLVAPSSVTGSRTWSQPTHFLYTHKEWYSKIENHPFDREGSPENWTKKAPTLNQVIEFKGDISNIKINPQSWPSGVYELKIEATDDQGTKDTLIKYIRLLNPASKAHNGFNNYLEVFSSAQKLNPGEVLGIYLSTLKKHCTHITIEKASGIAREGWRSVHNIDFFEVPIGEQDRGGVSIHYWSKIGSKIQVNHLRLDVPFDNKDLKIQWLTERASLYPGQNERWGFKVTDKMGRPVKANMTVTLFDASLDAFATQVWSKFEYNQRQSSLRYSLQQGLGNLSLGWSERMSRNDVRWSPPQWNLSFISQQVHMYSRSKSGGAYMMDAISVPESPMEFSRDAVPNAASAEGAGNSAEEVPIFVPLTLRENLEETAFFYTNLTTNKEGEVYFDFQMKEALTRWNLLAMAYDDDLASALFKQTLETKKDLMVFPYVPRFLRQKDIVHLKMTVRSQSNEAQFTRSNLLIEDVLTGNNLNHWIKSDVSITQTLQSHGQFDLEWVVAIPEDFTGLVKVTYESTGGNQSDGEVHYLPVLSNKIFIVETIPFTIQAGHHRILQLEKIKSRIENKSISDSNLSLQITENPAWYAVMALPELASGDFLTDQVLAKYYAASLSNEVVRRNPKIKEIFKSWKSSGTLVSELEKNESLKLTILNETPWVRQAASESEQRRRIAIYFEANQVAAQLNKSIQLLADLQNFDGGFPWYQGGPSNVHSTRQFLITMGYLDLLRVKDIRDDGMIRQMVTRAVPYIDKEIITYYKKQKSIVGTSSTPTSYALSEMVNYFFARSMYKDIPLSFELNKIQEEILDRIEANWLDIPDGIKPMAALLLSRNLRSKSAQKILTYFSQNLIRNEEIGYYLKSNSGYHWYQNPVQLHLNIMEAMVEIGHDPAIYQWMKLWLLNNKRGNAWTTPNTTAQAIYILFRESENWLSEEAEVSLQINDQIMSNITAKEAGTGGFSVVITNSMLSHTKPTVKITNQHKTTPVWGSLFHQYFTAQSNVLASDKQLPLQISKEYLLLKDGQPALPLDITQKPVLKVGDKVKVKMVLKVDRPLEFVHLKDHRPMGSEPWLSQSGYRWSGGLGFYQAITDTGADYFIQYLPTGSHVLEFDIVISHKGEFTVGPAQIQSFYAPEFSAQSSGGSVIVN